VYKNLKRATISIQKYGGGREKNPLGCLKKWLGTKTSGEIWFQYLIEHHY
jgi:hypothetical protein